MLEHGSPGVWGAQADVSRLRARLAFYNASAVPSLGANCANDPAADVTRHRATPLALYLELLAYFDTVSPSLDVFRDEIE